MMSKKLVAQIILFSGWLLFTFMVTPLYAQYTFTDFHAANSQPQYQADHGSVNDIDYNHMYLSLQSDLNLNANGLTNDFIRQYYIGNFLDTELKTKNLDRLKTRNNLLGYNWTIQLLLNIPSKRKGLSYFASFGNYNYNEICYDKNFYQLMFFGNKELVDQDVPLDNQSYKLLKFQQIKGGIVKTWFKQNKVNVLSAGLGINNGQALLSYDIPQASFFTQDNAEYITLDMQMNMQRSDTLSSKFGAENGLGLSVDLSFYHRDANNSFEISLENLGFITWNKYSQSYKKDTLINFDGFEIKNLFDLQSETTEGITGDSILNEFGFSNQQGRFSTMIPMKGQINYTRFLWNNRISLSISLINYHFLRSFPLLRFEPTYCARFSRWKLSISPNLQYGGYGKLNLGMGLSASFKKKFFVSIRTDYLNGYFNTKYAAGMGGYVSIIKTL